MQASKQTKNNNAEAIKTQIEVQTIIVQMCKASDIWHTNYSKYQNNGEKAKFLI